MRGRRKGQSTVSMSLLPFLAVLICTMGALIVILVIMVQRAKLAAVAVSQEQIETANVAYQVELAAREERIQERDDFEWRTEILQERRTALSGELERAQAELGYAEEQLRELYTKLQNLKQQAAVLENKAQLSTGDDSKLTEMQRQIELARFELEEAKKNAAERPKSYAIVLHQSLHGTNRRPMYIECTRGGIYLQPEGIALRPGDFESPLGPGNPLDAALRAARAYLLKYSGKEELPYPLLLVRPDGAHAYSKARSAMKYWDDRFGFELVEADLEIAYPEPDPALAKVLADTISQARKRKAALALSMPSKYGQRGGGVGGYENAGFGPSGDSVNRGRDFRTGDSGGSGGEGETATGFYPTENNAPGGGSFSDQPGGDNAANNQPGGGRPNQKPGVENGNGGTGPQGYNQGNTQPGATPISARRGGNWAAPSDTKGATAIRRPVRVVVTADTLYLYPAQRGDPRPKVIPLEAGGVTGVENMVVALWKEVDQWGLAGSRSYWLPTLDLRAAPGGEQRLKEVRQLLKGSGITTE